MNLRRSSGLLLLAASLAISAQQTPQGPPPSVPFAGIAGPQRANDEGRSELPLVVRRSVSFREIGPAISGGRVTAVVGIPGKPGIYYVGAADGGIFRTADGGTTWQALFQHESVASIGALAVDPLNPNIVWAGTGEANVRNDASSGDGIYKSTDAGRHWNRMGLDRTFHISAIVIDPLHPGTVLVAAMGNPYADSDDRGVFRTTDGGLTWQKLLYIDPSTGISDLAMNPKNPQVLYAASYHFRRTPWNYSDGGPEDAIYRSVDQGLTWQRLSGHGLPEKPVTRIGLAIAAGDPSTVYAVMGSTEGVVWRSDDAGDHWFLVSKDEEADARPFYFSHIAVDPTDANHVFAISNNLMESKDGGHSFTAIAKQIHVDYHTMWIDPAGSGRIIDGNDGGVALSRDNGAHFAFLHNIAIAQFYHISVAGSSPYTVCGGLQDNSAWCGPARDKDPNGITDRAWITLNGGDGIYAIPAADNPNLIYDSTENGVFMVFDRAAQQVHDIEPYPRDMSGSGVVDTPYRFNWNAAFAVSPLAPKILYAGAQVVFKSEDRGRTWKPISPDLTRNDKEKQQSSGGPIVKDNSGAEYYDTILVIAPAPKDPNTLWIGTDDGQVQLTRDGGATWKNVTAAIPNLPAWSRIESIDVDASVSGSASVAVNAHFSGDFKPYLFCTSDYGATWHSISGDLPSAVSAHVVRRDLRNPHMYYAGLENGLYVTWDEGAHWYLFGLGLPNAAVYDVQLNAEENDLIVGTHGRSLWVLDDLAPFQQFTPQITQEAAHFFAPAPALRFWPWSQVEEEGDAAFYGRNPAYGAQLSYYLAKESKDPGELIIKDSDGRIVRTMKGTRPLGPDEAPPQEEDLPPAAGIPANTRQAEQHEARPTHPATPTQTAEQPPEEETEKPKEIPWISTKPGLQRIAWDLRSDGPVRWEAAKDFEKGPLSGALVPPGNYTATLTIAGQSITQPVTVVNDPASTADPAALRQRFDAAQSALHELSKLDVALNRLDAIRAQLEALRLAVKHSPQEKSVGDAADALEKSMKPVEAAITSNPGAAESTLRVANQIREHLFFVALILEGADDAPTPALLDQQKLLEPQYQAALKKFNDWLAADVAAFNRTMSEGKLTGVIPGDPLQP